MADERPLEQRVKGLEERMGTLEKIAVGLQTALEDSKDLQTERHEDTKHLIRRLEKFQVGILVGILMMLAKLFLTK